MRGIAKEKILGRIRVVTVFNKTELWNIGGIARLPDVGQSNDPYSAVEVAKTLAEALRVSDLPLSLVFYW